MQGQGGVQREEVMIIAQKQPGIISSRKGGPSATRRHAPGCRPGGKYLSLAEQPGIELPEGMIQESGEADP